jgi:carbamoyl-phosphate synthase/aspartate carbamoyltransferase
MPENIVSAARRAGIPVKETYNLDEVIGSTVCPFFSTSPPMLDSVRKLIALSCLFSFQDVLYVTRVQKERFDSEAEYDAVKSMFVIDNSVLARAKASAIVMHPLPRTSELDVELDFHPQAAYFRQMRHGLFVRMALLLSILG